MKVSTSLLKKVNGDPLVSASINMTDVNNVVSGIVQEQISQEVNNQIQNAQLSGDWVTKEMLTFK